MQRIFSKLLRYYSKKYYRFIYFLFYKGKDIKLSEVDGSKQSYIGLCEKLLFPFVDNRLPIVSVQNSLHGSKIDSIEAICRSFIGFSYYSSINPVANIELENYYRTQIVAGVTKQNIKFWGITKHQIIENTSIIIGLLLNNSFWESFSKYEQRAIEEFFRSHLELQIYQNNWLWFKLFHYYFLDVKTKENYNEEIKYLLDQIEGLYFDGGWYLDGKNETSFDYYNGWALIYYSLIFVLFDSGQYSEFSCRFKHRAQEFFNSYIHFFVKSGINIPYGRSQTYKFASLAPFGLGVKLGLISSKDYPKVRSVMDGTINAYLRGTIANKDGFLVPGVINHSAEMLEPYSGSGSSYWAMKAFSILLCSDDYWNSGYEDQKNKIERDALGRFFIRHDDHLIMVNNGMYHADYPFKYNKLAYSNKFFNTYDENSNNVYLKQGNRNYFISSYDFLGSTKTYLTLNIHLDNGVLLKGMIYPVEHGYVFVYRPEAMDRTYRVVISGFPYCREKSYLNILDNDIEYYIQKTTKTIDSQEWVTPIAVKVYNKECKYIIGYASVFSGSPKINKSEDEVIIGQNKIRLADLW
jgi:hypothetical protein